MRIQYAELIDAPKIVQLDKQTLGNDSRSEELVRAVQLQECVLVRVDDTICGFAVFHRSFFEQWFISLIIVSPECRRQGIASQLIHFIEQEVRSEKLFTSTNESNIPMQKVCEALGYVRSGIIENLDDGDPELIYFKQC